MLAGGEFGEVALFLAFGAGEEDVVGAEGIVRGNDDTDGAVDGGELFDGEHVVDVAEACAAVFGREDDAEEAHLAELLDDIHGELGSLVPAEDVGGDFAGGKVADFAAEGLLVFGEGEGEGGVLEVGGGLGGGGHEGSREEMKTGQSSRVGGICRATGWIIWPLIWRRTRKKNGTITTRSSRH